MNITINQNTIILTTGISLTAYRNSNAGYEWWNEILDFLEAWASPNPTVLLRTSGSTGTPKEFEVEKSKLWISALKTCEYFQLNENSTGLLCLSAKNIAGKMMLVRALASGMQLICVAPSQNPVNELTEPIDFAAMVPMQLQQSINSPDKFNLIRFLIVGGARLPKNTITELQQLKVTVFETFGMTETLSHIAVKQVTPISEPFFVPLNGVFILQGLNDVMVIDYPELGIYKMKTNDIIEILDSTGKFIWKGRTDFVINSGGVKLSPEAIEIQIESLFDKRFCLVGIPDNQLGEKLILVIEGESFDTADLPIKIREQLHPYLCPKTIIFVPKFPITATQKIDRIALSKQIVAKE